MTDSKHAVPILKSADELKREVTFIYYEPNKLDSHGDWTTQEVIEKACENFNSNLKSGNVVPNLFHSRDDEGNIEATDSFEILKSWVSPTDCIVGETEVDEGTWLVKVKMNNEVLWSKFLEGTISGVSFGAKGSRRGTS
jgi:hypothetical protein